MGLKGDKKKRKNSIKNLFTIMVNRMKYVQRRLKTRMDKNKIETVLTSEDLDTAQRVNAILKLYEEKEEEEKEKENKIMKLNPKETDEYKQLKKEFTKYKMKTILDGAGVKKKFRDDVVGRINDVGDDQDITKQINSLKKEYSEFFEQAEQSQEVEEEKPPTTPPAFSLPPLGGIDTPKTGGTTFSEIWNFEKNK